MVSISSHGDLILGIALGWLMSLTCLDLASLAFLRFHDIYGLGHWKLNFRTPQPSMWMNLGYWTSDSGKRAQHFDEATRALLKKMLQAAGLLSENESSKDSLTPGGSVAFLDVGIGCGDQTVALAQLVQARQRPLVRYVGLTLNATQLQAAQKKLEEAHVGSTRNTFQVFQADAARPSSWTDEIRASVDGLTDHALSERWLIGLDCLYHFSPSRRPIFEIAGRTLDANFLAFDLILNEKASKWETMLIRLLGFLLSCPWRTFLTESQYKNQLYECGYDRAQIDIEDVSDHVFAGLSHHLRRQDIALRQYGISFTGYRLVGKIYEWIDRTRVLKAAIILGRKKTKAQ